MNDWSGTMFYLGSFVGAFAFGFPLGPSSLEMLRLDAAGRHVQAWSLALGVAVADAAWALAAYTGLHPWLGTALPRHRGPLFLLSALVCTLLVWRGRSEASVRQPRHGKGKRFSHFWLGAFLGASYPLTCGSWVVALTVLRSFGWGIPSGPTWLVLFFAIVFFGYFSYLVLLRHLFARMHGRFPFFRENRLRQLPRVLLLALALLFLGLAVFEFLKKS